MCAIDLVYSIPVCWLNPRLHRPSHTPLYLQGNRKLFRHIDWPIRLCDQYVSIVIATARTTEFVRAYKRAAYRRKRRDELEKATENNYDSIQRRFIYCIGGVLWVPSYIDLSEKLNFNSCSISNGLWSCVTFFSNMQVNFSAIGLLVCGFLASGWSAPLQNEETEGEVFIPNLYQLLHNYN